jgi:hypothetical protein
MSRDVGESDWRLLRAVHPVALDRFCGRILGEVTNVIGDAGKSPHQKYLEVYRLIKRRDQEIAKAFNDIRRSTAFMLICSLRRLGLLTDEEFARFSDEMRSAVEAFVAP